MEAVPRLPMLSFGLKTALDSVSFSAKLKQYIANYYNEDPESYQNEIYNLEALRSAAVRPTTDVAGCELLKKYYCQLHFLKSRFPMEENQDAAVLFSWKDNYSELACSLADIRLELMCILYNIGALHTQLGAADSRVTPEGMKMTCTHFQCAAWAFQMVKEKYHSILPLLSSIEVVSFMNLVSLAQAQECILEKGMLDNRKSSIVSKVATQIVEYYRRALSIQQVANSDDPSFAVGTRNYKEWSKFITFKVAYLKSIILLYQGQEAEEQQKMGERVAFYQAASEQLEEAKKLAQGLKQKQEVAEALAFTTDVVEGKKKAAKNENEFIYHEAVPDRSSLPEVKGASLVKGISFSVSDPEVSGPDIFSRLVPMEAHEALSVYSEMKAQLLRNLGEIIDNKNKSLVEFMSSLQLEVLDQMQNTSGFPQEIVDRAAALAAKPTAIQDLTGAMKSLLGLHSDVDGMLNEIQKFLSEEEENEKKYQEQVGKRPASMIVADLSREAAKYREAHNKAKESNETLNKAVTSHLANLKLLNQPLPALKQQIPTIQLPNENIDENALKNIEKLLSKIEEMRTQRALLWNQLKDALHKDDITSAVVTKLPDQSLQSLFEKEFQKHHQAAALVEQNAAAQENILKALVDAYAQFTNTRKYMQEIINKRNQTISSLICSYDTYDELLNKANKGIEFYNKLESNVSKLLQRVKSTCKVQQEEREEMLSSLNIPKSQPIQPPPSNAPKLKDYLDTRKTERRDRTSRDAPDISGQASYAAAANISEVDTQVWPPAVRPTPVGSEVKSESLVYDSTASIQQNQTLPAGNLGYTPYIPQHYNYNATYNTTGAYNTSLNSSQYKYSGSNTVDQSLSNQLSEMSVSGESAAPAYGQQLQYQSQFVPSVQTGYSARQNTYNYTSSSDSMSNNQQYSSVGSHQYDSYKQGSYGSNTNCAQQVGSATTNMYENTNLVANIQPPSNPNVYGASSNQSFEYTGLAYQPGSVGTTSNLPQQYSAPSYQGVPSANIASTIQPQYTGTNYNVGTSLIQQHSNDSTLGQYTQDYKPTVSVPNQDTGYYNTQSDATGGYNVSNVTPNVAAEASSYNYTASQNGASASYNVANATQNLTPGASSYNFTASQSGVPTSEAYYTNVAPDGSGYYYGTENSRYGYQSSYYPPQYPQYAPQNEVNNTNPPADSIATKGLLSDTATVDSSHYYYNTQNTAMYPYPSYQQTSYTPASTESPAQSADAAAVDKNNSSCTSTTDSANYYYLQRGEAYPYTNTQETPNVVSGDATNQASGNVQSVTPNVSQPSVTAQDTKKESYVDLLAGLDFTVNQLPLVPEQHKKDDVAKSEQAATPVIPSKTVSKTTIPKSEATTSNATCTKKPLISKKALGNSEVKKLFSQEVEKFEKFVEMLGHKTLNGPTNLDLKWKEIMTKQESDNQKKIISVARCYPLKNRHSDILPYDYSRVELASTPDDYINASYVKNISPYAPTFIVTQAPLSSTFGDFWTMIYEKQVKLIACALNDTEIGSDVYWPQQKDKELQISRFVLTLKNVITKPYWTERYISLSLLERREYRMVVHLQFTAWPGSIFPTKADPFMTYVKEVVHFYQQEYTTDEPVVVHCSSGIGRSGLLCLLSIAILDVANNPVSLPDLAGLTSKLSSCRKSILRDREHLKFAYEAFLSYMKDVLAMTDTKKTLEQRSSVENNTANVFEDDDPLSKLDPYWVDKRQNC